MIKLPVSSETARDFDEGFADRINRRLSRLLHPPVLTPEQRAAEDERYAVQVAEYKARCIANTVRTRQEIPLGVKAVAGEDGEWRAFYGRDWSLVQTQFVRDEPFYKDSDDQDEEWVLTIGDVTITLESMADGWEVENSGIEVSVKTQPKEGPVGVIGWEQHYALLSSQERKEAAVHLKVKLLTVRERATQLEAQLAAIRLVEMEEGENA